MNNKAFTLIEVLATIIILGIIMVIIIPKILVSVDDTKIKVYKMKEDNLVQATKDYIIYNKTELPSVLDQRIKIGLLDLTNNGFSPKIYDSDDKSLCVGYVYITKTHTENYTYTPCIFCTNYSTTNVLCDISQV